MLKVFTPATHLDIERIHRLLVKCSLVNEGDVLSTAQKLMLARNYIISNTDGEVAMWVGYHDLTGDDCQMSVAIAPEWQGRIVTRRVLREMFEIPFNEFGVMNIKMSTSNPKTVVSLLSLGMKLSYDSGNVLLNKEEYERKFAMRG